MDAVQGAVYQRDYTYFAFISYKREDERWAKWLKNQLQRYRVPIATRRRYRQLPNQCKPVFLDKTNLTPGILDQQLQMEVQDARYLIIICSRNARAESTYLDWELWSIPICLPPHVRRIRSAQPAALC